MVAPKAKRSLKGIRKRPKLFAPQTDQEKRFCERWLIHFDKNRAWREAGYSPSGDGGTGPGKMLEKFADHLRPIREAKAKIMAERLAVDAEKIVAGMASKVFFDPTTFYERTLAPLTEWVKLPRAKERTERVVTWDGQPVYGERLKPYSDLTPEQQAVVQITNTEGDRIRYRLPTIGEQHSYLTSLGTQIGLFAQKLIVERHTHRHTHQHLSFDGVPTQKLTNLTRQMLPLVGLEFAQRLGYTAEDVEKAALEDGVVMAVNKASA